MAVEPAMSLEFNPPASETGFAESSAAPEAPRETVLQLDGVTKRFNVYKSGLHRLAHWLALPVKPVDSIVTVNNVSLTVTRGECLALIGQNGAGKSTLLKLITGTMAPSMGKIEVNASISAILELGLGFNPEFTGRENVRQSGGMMGHAPELIDGLLDEIEAFAEIGDFFDKPLRIYSSGMQARLAFALATAIRPEILIVDEVLSVGDAYFQHKSFARIREFRDSGSTIILVTHAMGDVRELCNRVILLDRGTVLKDGSPDEVVDYYNALVAEKENAKLTIEQRRHKNGWSITRSGDFRAVVDQMELVDAETGAGVATARVGQKLVLHTDVTVKDAVPRLILGLMIRDRTGHVVWGSNTWHTRQAVDKPPAGHTLRFSLAFECDLGPGSYSVSPALVSSDTHLDSNFEWTDNLLVFDVINPDRPMFIGSAFLDAAFSIDQRN